MWAQLPQQWWPFLTDLQRHFYLPPWIHVCAIILQGVVALTKRAFYSFTSQPPSTLYARPKSGSSMQRRSERLAAILNKNSSMITSAAHVSNWDRQKVPKLQLFLLFPLHWGTGGFHAKKVCPYVRVSSTIWVCKTQKWFKYFVRGTVETENSLNTHISRLCTETITNS